ncbi:MAG: hypothetical protein L6Q75_16035 [Burkholderiaceae bacterium]|nr:hypothetical protein [Burkholderiaceae bacterium]
MATPNYSYEKRQRELAKKRKAEEKAAEKRARKSSPRPDGSETVEGDEEAPGEPRGDAPADPATGPAA